MHQFHYDCIHHFKFRIAKNVTTREFIRADEANAYKMKILESTTWLKWCIFLAQLSLALMYYKMCIKISSYCTKIPEVKQSQWRWHFHSVLPLNTTSVFCYAIWLCGIPHNLFSFFPYDVIFLHTLIYSYNASIFLKINLSKFHTKDFSTHIGAVTDITVSFVCDS
jgi:hypothetical protein